NLRVSARDAVHQVCGLCVTADRRLVLVSKDGVNWTLPGGRPESGETWEETLVREVREEACAVVTGCAYLGAQRVDDPLDRRTFYQLRYVAAVELQEFLPTHEMRHRLCVDHDEARQRLWGG